MSGLSGIRLAVRCVPYAMYGVGIGEYLIHLRHPLEVTVDEMEGKIVL